jgi:hypothetical protein
MSAAFPLVRGLLFSYRCRMILRFLTKSHTALWILLSASLAMTRSSGRLWV